MAQFRQDYTIICLTPFTSVKIVSKIWSDEGNQKDLALYCTMTEPIKKLQIPFAPLARLSLVELNS